MTDIHFLCSRSIYLRLNRESFFFFKFFSIFISEDVSVGVWLAPLNISRKHDKRFDTEYHSRGCQNDHLVTHKCSPEVIRLYWSRIVQTGKMCDREYFTLMPYEYDWTVLSSYCCNSNSSVKPQGVSL